MPMKARNRAGRKARMFERADATLLVEHKFHPIEDMIKTTLKLEGMDRINAADKIARYFYPTRKAIEVEGEIDTDVVIRLGGICD
jgi:hypothetical protein